LVGCLDSAFGYWHSTVFISRMKRGVESPSVDSLVKIARALGVRVRTLVNDL